MEAIINEKSRHQCHVGERVIIIRKAFNNKVWVKFQNGREMSYNIAWLSKTKKEQNGQASFT